MPNYRKDDDNKVNALKILSVPLSPMGQKITFFIAIMVTRNIIL